MSSLFDSKFDYQKARSEVNLAGNVYSYAPIQGGSFSPSGNATIKIASSSAYLDPQKSWLSYDITFTDTNTAGALTVAGGAMVIKDVSTMINGKVIENFYNYNTFHAISCHHADETRKKTLNIIEGYQGSLLYAPVPSVTLVSSGTTFISTIAPATSFTASNAFAGTAASLIRTVHHSLENCLGRVNDTLIPLPFLQGGLQLDLNFSPVSEVANVSTLSSYTITNLRYNAYLITPEAGVSQSFLASLNAGNKAYIKMPIVKSMTSKPVASTSNQHILNIGINDSVRSVLQVERLTTSVQSSSTDDFNNFTNNSKKEFWVTCNNARYPSTFNIGCQNDSTYKIDPANLMYGLTAIDNDYSGFGFTKDIRALGGAVNNTDEFITYSFASTPLIGSGIPSLDGNVVVNTIYDVAPAGTETVNSYVLIDGEFIINSDMSSDYSTVGLR